MFIEIPNEDWEVGDEPRVGRLKLSLYGKQLAWLDVKLRQQYDMKSEVLGPEGNMKQAVRILNRTLRWGKKRGSSMRRTTGTRSRSCKNAQ